jgi:hypothetical protein
MTDRDYVSDMRAVIDREASGEYISGVVAVEIVGKLRANDPDLLGGWLDAQAVTLVHQAVNDRDRSLRARARTTGPRSVFAEAASRHERGDSSALESMLDAPYVVNAEDLRKPLGAMTSSDLTFVADGYRGRAASAAMEAAFFAALAKKVGSGTVADHFTDEKLSELRASLRA